MHILIFHAVDNHTNGAGIVGYRVYQDERTGGFVGLIRVKEEFLGSSQHYAGNLVQLHRQGLFRQPAVVKGEFLHCIDIYLILDIVNTRTAQIGSLLDEERFVYIHRFLVHPHYHGFEVTLHHRKIVGMYQHLSA